MQKPDLDNCLKALSDAIYTNDSGIYDIHVTKLWGKEGKIKIE
jgi:Holliday junction resolvase RusA-like endonuclease